MPPNYGPVVVRAELTGPYMDSGDPLHLDGLLTRAWVRRHANQVQGLGLPTRQTPLSQMQRPHLPLGRLVRSGVGVWLASAALEEDPTHPAAVWQIKRRDAEDIDRLARPINLSAGPAKDYMLRRPARLTPALTWYAWGKAREIRRSLRLLWGRENEPSLLGSARRSGSGEIARWSVEVGDHSPTDCLLRAGRVVRHVPREWLTAVEAPYLGACEPPYWHPERHRETARMLTGAQLHADVIEGLEALGS